jgi:hypothetical protein
MNRRNTIKNIGLLTGGIYLFPYSCQSSSEIIYSNFPEIKRNEQALVGQICNIILAEDPINFPTPEKRDQFVLTMINDCGSSKEINVLKDGMKYFRTNLSSDKKINFHDLKDEEKNVFVRTQFGSKTVFSEFLNLLKKYCVLHFETSENYLTQYLNFEFMPGRYLGRVAV